MEISKRAFLRLLAGAASTVGGMALSVAEEKIPRARIVGEKKGEKPQKKPPQKLRSPSPSRGLIYRVRKGDTAFWLAGTLHRLRAQDHPMPAAYEAAYKACKKVVFEVHPSELAAADAVRRMNEICFFPTGRTLDKEIGTELWNKAVAFAKNVKADVGTLATYRPFFAAMYLTDKAHDQLGVSSSLGVDNYYRRRCRGDGKAMGGLESANQMMDSLLKSSGALEESLRILEETVNGAKRLEDDFARMSDAWKAGDVSRLLPILEQSMAGAEVVRQKLIDERTAQWMEQIPSEVTNSLVLVGFSHLIGPKGFLSMLSQNGWETEGPAVP